MKWKDSTAEFFSLFNTSFSPIQIMKIAFLHPDLGIGGAERLIVDAALGLQNEGHTVTIYTSHCDKTHCFEEIKSGTLKVNVYGDWLPVGFLGRFKIVFAALRQLWLILTMILSGEISEFDFFIVDQLSYGIPLLHLFHEVHARILFYCHFPDQQLAKHEGLLRKVYRLPFDIFEQFSMSAADNVVVNSTFTKSIYDQTFPLIKDSLRPGVVYPCVDLTKEELKLETKTIFDNLIGSNEYFLSINRFEKKKNIELVVKAYALFFQSDPSTDLKLVITGGYDHLNAENKNYLELLESVVAELNLTSITVFNTEYSKYTRVTQYQVLFLPSISSNLKELFLSKAKLLTYTPSFEHFGIVPLEAMKFGTPVLAVNNGGPVETVINIDENPEQGTGWLEPSDPKLWSLRLAQSLKLSKADILKHGEDQLNTNFTLIKMTENFERTMLRTLKQPLRKYSWEKLIHLWKLPIFFYVHQRVEEKLFAYAIIVTLFFPPGIFQLLAIGSVTLMYKINPAWFIKWW